MHKALYPMKPFNDFLTFVYRILLLYVLFMLCRVVFYIYNYDLTGAVTWTELPRLLKGALIFDSGSIFYINLPFLLLSLLPFRFRSNRIYQNILMWLFVVVNGIGLAVNIADIFYYPYKLGPIASDDLHFTTNGNFGSLMWSFFKDFWWGFLLWGAMVFALWFGFKKIGYRATQIKNNVIYFISQLALLGLAGFTAVVLIRGGNISGATYPINISDASLYASPSKTGLILSNPFALIRTMGQSVWYPEYFPKEELDGIFSPVQPPPNSQLRIEGTPNIVLLILESFATAHIKELSDQFGPDDVSYTPFLDSLIRSGYIFRNAFQNGIRSIDALPALWTSIPSFKTQFLSMPQSSAPMQSLPMILRDMGYSTAFMHGAVKESMSFVAFGNQVGVQTFVSREEYEKANGRNDFDSKWGIWDHKFFPFAAENMNELQQPFFATMFSLSSHHPFRLPAGFEGRYPEGNLPIHKMIAYSDDALRSMFAQMSEYDWFDNTIFIITGDHGSGADNEKYLKAPYNFSIPILFYSPAYGLHGESYRAAGHLDVMPTILGMFGYDKPFFAFGKDLFSDSTYDRTINYMGSFNTITDSFLYIFNESELTAVYDYRSDPLQEYNLVTEFSEQDSTLVWTKAFIQQYYKHVKERDYLPSQSASNLRSQ
ncbi:MAG: sulfatase-like hydrolase/transferase [Rikenellaceae bacterium]|nr:sulfatase-like hydrolase/transferase [Rikenellaceae bacterium]